MQLVLAYSHYQQHYVGGLFKRAAKRLGLDVVSIGPKAGTWTAAPAEKDWEPDVETGSGVIDLPVRCDAVILIDQSTGFYVKVPPEVPFGVVQTESNPTEPERAWAYGPKALWSLMYTKKSAQLPFVWPLKWGYDPVYTPSTDPSQDRIWDFALHGTPSKYREEVETAICRSVNQSTNGRYSAWGPCQSRSEWGHLLQYTKITLCDHDEEFVSGRVVDSVAAGVLVLAKKSAAMDELIPGGYVPIRRRSDGWPDVADVVDKTRSFLKKPKCRALIVRRGQNLIKDLTWDNHLKMILTTLGVWTGQI